MYANLLNSEIVFSIERYPKPAANNLKLDNIISQLLINVL